MNGPLESRRKLHFQIYVSIKAANVIYARKQKATKTADQEVFLSLSENLQ